jgi:hypothetical protein
MRPVCTKLQPSPGGLGKDRQDCGALEARHYLHSFWVPHLRRSDDVAESMSQPSRAGLKFGYRPYGPGSDLRYIAGYHTGSNVLGCSQPSLRDLIGRA